MMDSGRAPPDLGRPLRVVCMNQYGSRPSVSQVASFGDPRRPVVGVRGVVGPAEEPHDRVAAEGHRTHRRRGLRSNASTSSGRLARAAEQGASVEDHPVRAVAVQQLVERPVLVAAVGQRPVADLHHPAPPGARGAQEGIEGRQLVGSERGGQLHPEGADPLAERFEGAQELGERCVDVSQPAVVAELPGELADEPEPGVDRLGPPPGRVPTRHRVEGGVRLDGGAPEGVGGELGPRAGVRGEVSTHPVAVGPHRTADPQHGPSGHGWRATSSTADSSPSAWSPSSTLIVVMPIARAGLRLMPRSSRNTHAAGSTPSPSQASS